MQINCSGFVYSECLRSVGGWPVEGALHFNLCFTDISFLGSSVYSLLNREREFEMVVRGKELIISYRITLLSNL